MQSSSNGLQLSHLAVNTAAGSAVVRGKLGPKKLILEVLLELIFQFALSPV